MQEISCRCLFLPTVCNLDFAKLIRIWTLPRHRGEENTVVCREPERMDGLPSLERHIGRMAQTELRELNKRLNIKNLYLTYER